MSEDWPGADSWGEAWQKKSWTPLGLRLCMRRPEVVWEVMHPWLADFADATRRYVDDAGPRPHARYLRLGSDLGNGEWVGEIEPSNLERLRSSYEDFVGGVGGWTMGDSKSTATGVIGLARAAIDTDESQIFGAAKLFYIDGGKMGVPTELENSWIAFLSQMVTRFDVLYGEIAPRLDDQDDLTEYEKATGRKPNWQVTYAEVETRLRGCGWVTWIPSHFLSVLGVDNLRTSGAFYSVTQIEGKGALAQATERSSEYTYEKERIVQAFLRPVLEPDQLD